MLRWPTQYSPMVIATAWVCHRSSKTSFIIYLWYGQHDERDMNMLSKVKRVISWKEAWSRVKVEKLFLCMVRGGTVLPKCFSCVVRARTVLPKCFSRVVRGGTVLPKCFSRMVRGRIMPEKCFSCLIRLGACQKTDFSCLFRCQTWHKRHKFSKKWTENWIFSSFLCRYMTFLCIKCGIKDVILN